MAKTNQKFKELTDLDAARLAREMDESYRQLFTQRIQVATRQLQNVREIRKVKRKIARIKTLQRQHELGLGRGAR
jgi:large subunit ribosomal protein L29